MANFRNSETLEWKNENKKTKLCNSEILLNMYFLCYLTRGFFLRFPSYVTFIKCTSYTLEIF